MTNYVYSVFDYGSGLYNPPFVAANDDMAVRNYLYIYGEPDSIRRRCTQLRRIGIWNNETGFFDSVDPENISGILFDFVDLLHSEDKLDGETSET